MSDGNNFLPDHWIEGVLENYIDFIDYRGKTPEKLENGMRLITAKNVKKGFVQVEPREFVNPAIYDDWMTRGIPKKGDVLFTTEAPLGNVAQLDTDDKVVFAQRIIIMQPDSTQLDSTFLKYMLLSEFMQRRIQEKGTGATAKGIKSKLLKKIPLAFPDTVAEQKRIVSILDEALGAIERAKENAEKNLANARELFESYCVLPVSLQFANFAASDGSRASSGRSGVGLGRIVTWSLGRGRERGRLKARRACRRRIVRRLPVDRRDPRADPAAGHRSSG